MTVNLDLSDPGWLRIDDASLRVRGSLDNIIREMETVLGDEVVRSLCRTLGILSTGFFFIDPHLFYTSFFDEKKGVSPKTYGTSYVWHNEAMATQWSDVIHWLFVLVRNLQREKADAAADARNLDIFRTEDFYRHIPKDVGGGYCPTERDRSIRRAYSFHYVTLGETVITTLAWRLLVYAVARGDGDKAIADLGDVDIDCHLSTPSLTCCWNGINLLENRPSSGNEQMVERLEAAWNLLSDAGLRGECERLGVTESSEGSRSVEMDAAILFAKGAGIVAEDHNGTAADLLTSVQRAIPRLLRLFGDVSQPITVREMLTHFETYARFPLIPFFTWHALDMAPKCYLVTPVWTSQQYSIQVDDSECSTCRHLGLALSAVSPLRRIDWTIPEAASDDSQWSTADPSVITNVIRLMARPLVEEHLYGNALRQLRKQIDDVLQKSANAVIDKLGQ